MDGGHRQSTNASQAGSCNFTQGATGLLYYRADGWTAGNAIGSWNNRGHTACGGGLGGRATNLLVRRHQSGRPKSKHQAFV